MLSIADLKIAGIGLGYVGSPLVVEFGKKSIVFIFDIYQNRIDELKKMHSLGKLKHVLY